MKYRSDIDGLRAIAVLSVVGFHTFPHWIRGGFIGVDIFFVISGYLISSIIISELEAQRFSIGKFYNRRIRRIFPSLLAIMITSLIIGWHTLLASEYYQLGKHISGGAIFASNFILWQESGYFDNAAETKPMLHLWSLAIEEQFYIFWPLILGLIWRRKRSFFFVVIAIISASFIANIILSARAPIAAFYLPHARFWELLTGAGLAYTAQNKWKPQYPYNDAKSATGFILLAIGFCVISKETAFPSWRALFPTLGAFFLISAGSGALFNRTLLSSRPLVLVGLISYPLYLWHWVLLTFARILFGDLDWMAAAVIVAISFLLSFLTYRWIELPIRYSKSRFTPGFLILGMTLVFGTALTIKINEGEPQRPVAIATEKYQREVFDYGQHWSGWSDCAFVKASNPNLGGCKVLDNKKEISIVVIGDSHAGHLATGLRNYFNGTGQNVAILLHAGCYPFYSTLIGTKEHFSCDSNLINSALDFASSKNTVKLIVLTGYANLHIYGKRLHETPRPSDPSTLEKQIAFETGFRNTLTTLSASNKKIIYLIDNPELLNDPAPCIDRGISIIKTKCDINMPKVDVLARNSIHMSIIDRNKVFFPKVAFLPMGDALCDATECRGVDPGGLLYQSRDHLSPHGSTVVVKYIFDKFDWRTYMKQTQ